MKQLFLSFCLFTTGALLISCNNNTDGDTTSNDTANNVNTAGDTVDALRLNPSPLGAQDSSFVLEAAMGSLVEIQSGNLAQQNGNNARVKNFGNMMVADHTKASNDLKAMVGGRVMLPDSIPADKKKHMDQMSKMKGKSFDNHYMNMMVSDHKKTIDLFRKQSENGTDQQLKSWAAATLPVLQKHLDSAQAIQRNLK